MNPTVLATSGPLLLAAVVAVAAGALSFASPCVVPLVPGYLAYLAGLVGADAPAVHTQGPAQRGRWRVAGAALLFVAGFTVVFGAGSILVLGLSNALLDNELLLERIGGVVTIVMGLVFIGLIPFLQRDVRPHAAPRAGLIGAPLLGAVFALGWTPCLGPTLTGVMSVAAGTQVGPGTLRGVLLVIAYCLGLGVPFVVLALGARWAVRATGWLRRHVRGVQIAGGVLLLCVGFALVTGLWGDLVDWLRETVVTTVNLPL
ncbi:MAG TPA: cytochrome c biogenesis CcdA family protein [Pseudonocardiaceae bacterium]|nr:cytochrome c biogenesis CcdA family protein [Pseudonocardiaceae bacterium]